MLTSSQWIDDFRLCHKISREGVQQSSIIREFLGVVPLKVSEHTIVSDENIGPSFAPIGNLAVEPHSAAAKDPPLTERRTTVLIGRTGIAFWNAVFMTGFVFLSPNSRTGGGGSSGSVPFGVFFRCGRETAPFPCEKSALAQLARLRFRIGPCDSFKSENFLTNLAIQSIVFSDIPV